MARGTVEGCSGPRRIEVAGAGGLRLSVLEWGSGAGPGVVLLHGLMGNAGVWEGTARWLAGEGHRVVAPDQRGHGGSGRPEGAYGREAFVADAAAVVRAAFGGEPVVVVGHSMGALNAWQLAARCPELVAGLVICDMRAAAPGERSQRAWEEWLAAWPVPFASREAAREWFATRDPWAGRAARADYLAGLMVRAADGWRPHFEPRHMLRAREGWATEPHWDELAAIGCPALVVRGGDGVLGRAEAQEMVRVLPRGAYAEVPDAGHHLPWERPEEWYGLLATFLAGLRPDPADPADRADANGTPAPTSPAPTSTPAS